MTNFKEIAEKCLAGELSGTFKNRQGDSIPSHMLHKFDNAKYPYIYRDNCITINGCYFRSNKFSNYDIIDFVPDNMQEQIKIDIPEGKVPVMEQTEKGVFITWKEKELTYDEIYEHLHKNKVAINYFVTKGVINNENESFLKKTNILRKLTNIRNYFGKPENMLEGWCIAYSKRYNTFTVNYINDADRWFSGVLFKEGEHAEQAIKMLGDELKYLFEPW